MRKSENDVHVNDDPSFHVISLCNLMRSEYAKNANKNEQWRVEYPGAMELIKSEYFA